jgi:hypothetical protein
MLTMQKEKMMMMMTMMKINMDNLFDYSLTAN